jgi:hypothetical protein
LLYRDYTVVLVKSVIINIIYSVFNSAINNSALTPLLVRERVCWRPHETLITSTFKPGNMLICCGQLYLDMVGPVPGYKGTIVLNSFLDPDYTAVQNVMDSSLVFKLTNIHMNTDNTLKISCFVNHTKFASSPEHTSIST